MPLELREKGRLLAVAAHFDDVELACGGTVARAVQHGYRVKILVLSDSVDVSLEGAVRRDPAQARREGEHACALLGVHEVEVLDYPNRDVPGGSTTISAIERRIKTFDPSLIITHWPFDTHQDHRTVALATLSAARYYRSIMMFEPMMPSGRSWVGFRPQVYVDITDHLPRKLNALRAYASQYEKYGPDWVEAVEARSRLRGFEIGVKHAEAFEVLRFEWMP